MIIAIDVRSMQQAWGGVAHYTRSIVQDLIREDGDHTYILFSSGIKKEDDGIPERGKHHQRVHLSIPNKVFHFSSMMFQRPAIDEIIARRIGRIPDLLFFPNIHFAQWSHRTPAVLTVHDLSFEYYPYTFSLKMRLWHQCVNPKKMIRRMNGLIAVSHRTAHALQSRYGISPSDMSVIHLAAKKSSGETRQRPRDLFVLFASHEQRKNAVAVIEGFGLACRLYPKVMEPYSLLLVGIAKKIHALFDDCINRSIPAGRCTVMNVVSKDEQEDIFARSAALLYPSMYEGFGLPLVEAAVRNIPIISSPRGSIGEVIDSGALLVDPYNCSEIARAFMEIVTDRSLKDGLSEHQRNRMQEFSWEKTARETRDVFDRILHAKTV